MTISLMQLASARLGYLSDAQDLLAGNLANIDTPGYQPNSVIAFSDFLYGSANRVTMLQNDPNDLPGLADPSPVANPVSVSSEHSPGSTGEHSPGSSGEHSLDGNAVSLDQQLVAISKNQTDQQFTANLYQSYMGMFKTALGSAN